MTRQINKLSDLEIDEVSLVDSFANQHADIVISKRDEDGEETEEEVDKANPDQSDVSYHDEDQKKKDKEKTEKGFFSNLVDKMFATGEFTTDEEGSGNIASMSEGDEHTEPDDVSKVGLNPGMQLPYGMAPQGMPAPGPQNAMPGMQPFPGQPGQMQAGPPLPQEVIQYIQQLEQAVAAAQGGLNKPSGEHQEDDSVNPFGKNMDTLDDDEVTFLQELSKNLEDEETREAVSKAMEIVEKANERAEEAETIAKAERDHRLTQEYVAKAKTYTSLPIDPDEFGPVLKRLHEALSEEDIEQVNKVLAAANETVASVGAFDEVGKRGIEGYEMVSKLDNLAKERVEKSDGDLTMETARMEILEERPELYDEYLQESGR